MNEVVKYKNEFNDIVLNGFSDKELSVFFALCAKVQGKKDEVISITYKDIKAIADYKPKSNKAMTAFLKRLSKKILSASIVSNSKSGLDFNMFVIFTELSTHFENQSEPYINISVNPRFEFFLNHLVESGGFTKFDLIDYVKFEYSYTQECFRRLKQFRATGYWKVSLEKFKELLSIPQSFTISKIDERVLRPINKELSDYYNHFEIKKIYKKHGRGRPSVVGFEFFFDKESVETYVDGKYDNLDSYKKPVIDQIEPQYPKKKEAKIGKKVTNVPDWSDGDYQNETSDDELERLAKAKQEILERLDKINK